MDDSQTNNGRTHVGPQVVACCQAGSVYYYLLHVVPQYCSMVVQCTIIYRNACYTTILFNKLFIHQSVPLNIR